LETAEVRIDLSDRGLTLGDGLFETMLWTGEEIRFFDDHMARMGHGARELGLSLPMNAVSIEQGLTALAKASDKRPAALRLMVTRGPGPRGLRVPNISKPNMLATVTQLTPTFEPVSVRVVDVWRASGAPSSRFKTLSYVDNVVALSRAQALGVDDGLMRGPEESVACATSANLLIQKDGVWFTPPVTDGALPGIIRGRLLRAGLVKEARVSLYDLAICQAACLTNAISGVRPIHMIDGRNIDVHSDRFVSLSAQLV